MRKKFVKFVSKSTADQYAKDHRLNVDPQPIEDGVFSYKLPRVPVASTPQS